METFKAKFIGGLSPARTTVQVKARTIGRAAARALKLVGDNYVMIDISEVKRGK